MRFLETFRVASLCLLTAFACVNEPDGLPPNRGVTGGSSGQAAGGANAGQSGQGGAGFGQSQIGSSPDAGHSAGGDGGTAGKAGPGGGAGQGIGGTAAGTGGSAPGPQGGVGGTAGSSGNDVPVGTWFDSDVPNLVAPIPAKLSGDSITVVGSGSGFVYGAHPSTDHFHFVYQALTGDGAISARIEIDQDDSCYGGVVFREGLGEVDRFVGFVALLNSHPDTHTERVDMNFSARLVPEVHTAQDGMYNRNHRVDKMPGPHWVKVERLGNDVKGSTSVDGATWQAFYSYTGVLQGNKILVGVMATPAKCTVRFNKVTIESL